jgi:hypothetical protein
MTPTRAEVAAMNRDDAFLRALYSASGLAGGGRLKAEQVNGLGETLQIPRSEILQLVERLQNDGRVAVHWGGELSLTSKGIEDARGEAAGRRDAPGGITAGGSVYVVQSSPNAVVGPGAMGPGAIRIEAPIGDLVAALEALRAIRPDLDASAHEYAQALEGELQATIEGTQRPNADREVAKEHVKRSRSLLDRLTQVADATGKLKPLLDLATPAVDAATKWLSSG